MRQLSKRERPGGRTLRRVTPWLAVLMSALTAAASEPLRLPVDAAPPAVRALESPDRPAALAIASDAGWAAAAFRVGENPDHSTVRLADAEGEVREHEIKGAVLSLRFGPAARTLFALVQRAGRKGIRDSYLYAIDTATLAGRRAVSLPDSARYLDLWRAGSALLVACENEIRTVSVPALRSGPLFWIRGSNLSLAWLPGGELVLVGQSDRLLLFNLSDPQGRDEMPVRELVAVPAPVVELAAAPDGSAALARLSDGRTLRIGLDPLKFADEGVRSMFVAWLGEPVETEVPARPQPAKRPPASARDVAASEPTRKPPAASDAKPEPSAAEPAALPQVQKEPAPAPAKPARVEPTVVGPAAHPAAGEIEGRIGGPARSEVVAVVVLGPDNILREAARVRPDDRGLWTVRGLAPGRYRVVLDGGGERVLVTRPPFLLLTVEPGQRLRAGELVVLRAL